jgi:GNAT superfamily N-acetyltransferase
VSNRPYTAKELRDGRGGAPTEIRTLAEVPAALYPQIAALAVLDGDPPLGIEYIRTLRRLHYPATDYFALYGIESGQIVSKVETIDVPFRSEHGEETLTGISEVLTRPDGIGRGYARALMEAVHMRERGSGRRWSLLWTHRTWGAHRLYERLGYTDVYSFPSALKHVGRGARIPIPRGYAWQLVQRGKTGVLDRLLSASMRGRWGFVRRFPRSFHARIALGWNEPKHFRVLTYRGTPVGYARAVAGPRGLTVEEAVVIGMEHAEAMVLALERLATGTWLTITRTSFVRDAGDFLRDRGFQRFSTAHATMMAKPLNAEPGGPDDPATVCASARFTCHRGDMF